MIKKLTKSQLSPTHASTKYCEVLATVASYRPCCQRSRSASACCFCPHTAHESAAASVSRHVYPRHGEYTLCLDECRFTVFLVLYFYVRLSNFFFSALLSFHTVTTQWLLIGFAARRYQHVDLRPNSISLAGRKPGRRLA